MTIITAQLILFLGILITGATLEESQETPDKGIEFSLPSDYLLLEGDIDDNNTSSFIYSLAERTASPAVEESREVAVKIDSFGGSVFTGYRIMALMDSAKHRGYRFTCYVGRKAMSMAFIVFAGCDRRLAGPYSLLLFHPVRTYVTGPITAEKAREIADGLEILTHEVDEFLMDTLRMDKKTYDYHNEKETLWKSSALKEKSPGFLEIVHLK